MMKTNKRKEALRRIRKYIYYTVCLFAAGVFVFCSCMNMNNPDDEANPPVLAPLKGTAWKLAGFADAETGVLTELDGTDCEKCYKLTFVTDVKARGWSMFNERQVSFWDSIQISPTNVSFSKKPLSGGTKIGEPPTPTRYTDALADLTSYICYNNELKLFYNRDKNYLLFKPVEVSGEPDKTIENVTGILYYSDECETWGVRYGYPETIDNVDIYLIKNPDEHFPFEENKKVKVSGSCYLTDALFPVPAGTTVYYTVITDLTYE